MDQVEAPKWGEQLEGQGAFTQWALGGDKKKVNVKKPEGLGTGRNGS